MPVRRGTRPALGTEEGPAPIPKVRWRPILPWGDPLLWSMTGASLLSGPEGTCPIWESKGDMPSPFWGRSEGPSCPVRRVGALRLVLPTCHPSWPEPLWWETSRLSLPRISPARISPLLRVLVLRPPPTKNARSVYVCA